MKERGIPFSPAMVRSVLADTKTQTRRVVQWRDVAPGLNLGFSGLGAYSYVPGLWTLESRRGDGAWERRCEPTRCPYGVAGDQLWVREAWRTVAEADALPPRDLRPAHRVWYEADTPHQPGAGRYRPGMFLPRWASRITLEITAVRVERLQAISEADALAEGITFDEDEQSWRNGLALPPSGREGWSSTGWASPVAAYRSLWLEINGPGSWEANPWVWVVVFRRVG